MSLSPPPALRPSTPATTGGGQVVIAARWSGREIADCRLESRRPEASRLLIGKTPAEVLALVPRLFSLCGRAQHAVAAAALAAAAGPTATPPAVAEAVWREAIGEHLWRLLLDWPRNLQKKPDSAAFAGWYKRLRSDESALEIVPALLDETAWSRFAPLLEDLQGWERAVTLAPSFLPTLDPALAAELFARADAAFAQRPSWRGQPAEVGALARFAADAEVGALLAQGRPLAARLRARWLALRADLESLLNPDAGTLIQAATGADGVAYGWLETARGPLCHRVVLAGGRVADYAVIAPTEWNFHPLSAWAAALNGQRAESPEIAENLLRLWALALDPCVPVQITLTQEN